MHQGLWILNTVMFFTSKFSDDNKDSAAKTIITHPTHQKKTHNVPGFEYKIILKKNDNFRCVCYDPKHPPDENLVTVDSLYKRIL